MSESREVTTLAAPKLGGPRRIESLYKTCGAIPISNILKKARWTLFGHVLRLNPETPAQLAMDYYCRGACEEVEGGTTVKGRTLTTLPVTLFNEYHSHKQTQKTKKSNYRQKPQTALNELRKLDKIEWRQLVRKITES